jgi:small subunit ribosomal protein S16
VAVKIRLKRMGKIRAPFYRVVVMDSRTKRDGRAIEEIGKYHPTEQPSLIDLDLERAKYWLSQGAQPTEAVAALIKIVDEGKLQTKEPKTPKKDLYEAAVAAAGGKNDAGTDGPTPRKKAAKKAEPKVEAKPETVDAEAVEDVVEAQVTNELEADRTETSEKSES